jgi:hypothetical protein
MMAMLIRAGLPSRRAAMAAIEDAEPVFVTPAEMRAWLESDEITAYTDAGDWPTPDTAALWARFRTEALSGGIQKWSVERYKRLLDIEVAPPAGLYRIVTDEGDGRTWLATPDYQRVAAFKKPAVDPKPSLFSGRLPGNTGSWKPCASAAENCAGRPPMRKWEPRRERMLGGLLTAVENTPHWRPELRRESCTAPTSWSAAAARARPCSSCSTPQSARTSEARERPSIGAGIGCSG